LTICNAEAGVAVPIPTDPVLVIVSAAAPLVVRESWLAAGEYRPLTGRVAVVVVMPIAPLTSSLSEGVVMPMPTKTSLLGMDRSPSHQDRM
jgi:hypothetical protein